MVTLKKPLKILGWTAGSFAALLILLVVGLRLFLPAEKLRDLAVARASASLGREVTVKDVRVSLRGGLGIQLTDVSVGNPVGFPAGHLMTAENVDLKLQLRPLFSRQVHADRLVINAPRIILTKLDSARNNFTFDGGKPTRPASPVAPPDSSGATLNFDRFECNGGFLSFQDVEAGGGFELTGLHLNWTVTDAGAGRLDCRGDTEADSLKVTGAQKFAAGPVTLAHSARLDTKQNRFTLEQGALALGGLDFTVTAEGQYGQGTPVMRAEIGSETLDLATVLALAAENKPGTLDEIRPDGKLALRTVLTFDQARDDPLNIEGSCELTGGRFELPKFSDPITDLSARGVFNLDTLRVTASQARISGANLNYTGAVTGLKQPAEARTEGTIHLTADLARLQGYLPAERKATLAGKATGTIKLAGRLDSPGDLPTGGEITLTDLSYRDANIFEPVTDLDATLAFGPRDVTIKSCAVKFQPSNFTLSGVVKGLVPALQKKHGPKPHLDFTLNSQLLNVDHLFPAASPGAVTKGAASPPVIAEFPDVTGSGAVSIANLIYGGVAFTGITGKVAVADRAVKISEAAGAVFAGKITGQTTVDLNSMTTPGYKGSFAAQGIQADSLLSRFTPLKNHVFGGLDFGGTYTAAGKDPAAFRRSLSLDAQSAMTQGRLVTSGVIQQGLNTLARKLGRTFDQEEKLKDLAGPVKVSGERVILERFTSELPGLGTLSIGGSYGFTGDLDFRGELLLTEENSRKLLGSAGSGLTGAIGNILGKKEPATVPRLKLPVKIGGAFTKPEVALDFSAMAKARGQEAADELKGKLEGMFKK